MLRDVTKVNLGKANAYCPCHITKIRSNMITQGIQSYIWPASLRGKLPKLIIVAFVDYLAYSGNFNRTPLLFEIFTSMDYI